MFSYAADFNGNISEWNVSNVTNMSNMFNGAAAFNSDIGRWNVSKVTNMSGMFYAAAAFNGDISGVTDMFLMFYDATSFTQNLEDWGSKLKSGVDKSNMFSRSGVVIAKTLPSWCEDSDCLESPFK